MGFGASGRNGSVGVNKVANPDEAIADAVTAAMIEFARRPGHPHYSSGVFDPQQDRFTPSCGTN